MTAVPVARSRRAGLALRLGVGAVLLIAAAWLFGAIAEDVATSDRITVTDVELARWLRAHATPELTRWMLLVTNLHSTIAVSCYGAVVGALLAWRREWRRLATVFVCVAGGLALNVGMKLAFHRARPVLDDPLLTLASYSFPSGHVAGSTIAYGLLVVWVFGRTRRSLLRVLAVVGALLVIALVAFTRMYLGVHYLSDVVAAFAEGVAWLALCLSALTTFWGHAPLRRPRDPHEALDADAATSSSLSSDAIVIVNAGSGQGNDQELVARLQRLFDTARLKATIELARGGDEISAAVKKAIAARPRMVVAGGGDGTVSSVAAALVGTDITFGVLPLGTLNHFAKDLGVPLELADAVAVLAEGRAARVDVGEVNGRIFVNNSSLGLYPDIVRDRERQQKRLGRGKWPALAWATIGALRRYPFLGVKLAVDGREATRRTPFVFIGNNEYQMEGFAIGERSTIDDGRLSLYVAQRPGRWRLLLLALRALTGRLRQARDFDAILATEITVQSGRRRLRVATDGEVTVMTPPLQYRVRPAALIVMRPQARRDAD